MEQSKLELLEGLQLLYPAPNGQYKSPLMFRFMLHTPDYNEMLEVYGNRHWLCLQLDGVWQRCIAIDSVTLITEPIAVGNHTARIGVTDSATPGTGTLLRQSEEASFAVLSEAAFTAMIAQQRRDEAELFGSGRDKEDVGVLQWFRLRESERNSLENVVTREVNSAGQVKPVWVSEDTPTDPPFLVIGVKTRVIAGFPFRQAIRETWASMDVLPRKVRVRFAGCRLPADSAEVLKQAIAYEQQVYGDLLTDVLDCEDSYAALTVKVKEFLHLVGTDHALRRASYVMIADEDSYLRVDILADQLTSNGPLHDIYAGHVKDGRLFRPERDPTRRYYLPESVYPMDEFPPFAWGPHYFMSMDVAEFISDNHVELQGLGGLDDVSVALWLLAIQVHPQHIEVFQNLRESPCTENILAYADLSPSAMRIIDSNLRSGRNFCHGFNPYTWDKGGVSKEAQA